MEYDIMSPQTILKNHPSCPQKLYARPLSWAEIHLDHYRAGYDFGICLNQIVSDNSEPIGFPRVIQSAFPNTYISMLVRHYIILSWNTVVAYGKVFSSDIDEMEKHSLEQWANLMDADLSHPIITVTDMKQISLIRENTGSIRITPAVFEGWKVSVDKSDKEATILLDVDVFLQFIHRLENRIDFNETLLVELVEGRRSQVASYKVDS